MGAHVALRISLCGWTDDSIGVTKPFLLPLVGLYWNIQGRINTKRTFETSERRCLLSSAKKHNGRFSIISNRQNGRFLLSAIDKMVGYYYQQQTKWWVAVITNRHRGTLLLPAVGKMVGCKIINNRQSGRLLL